MVQSFLSLLSEPALQGSSVAQRPRAKTGPPRIAHTVQPVAESSETTPTVARSSTAVGSDAGDDRRLAFGASASSGVARSAPRLAGPVLHPGGPTRRRCRR